MYFFFPCQKWLFSQAKEINQQSIFSAVFWDRFTTKSITYAPWGNFDDLNATKITLQVGFSTPTKPFVYYGKPPIKFLKLSLLKMKMKMVLTKKRLKNSANFHLSRIQELRRNYF